MGAEGCPWGELLPAYALGALDEPDRQGMIDHLRAGCGSCEVELVALRREVQALAESPPPVVPPPDTREWLLERVRPRPWIARWPLAAAAALALLLALTSLAWGGSLWRRLEQAESERGRLAAALAASEARLARVEAARQAAERALAVVTGPPLRQVRLAGLGPAEAASGHLLVDAAARRALFAARGLPSLAPGSTYQLWLIAAGAPLSGGTFEVRPDGCGRLVVEGLPPLAGIAGWAVTIEPAGGLPQPSGAMVLKS